MADTNINFQEAVAKYKIEDLIDLEKKLYLISLFIDYNKAYNTSLLLLNKEITIFQEITFIIKRLSSEENVIKFSGIIYHLSQFKRIINFIDDKPQKIFVYNNAYFIKKLKEKEFKLFEYTDINKSIDSKDSLKSLKSQFNEQEITDIYSNETIKEIKKIEISDEKLLEKFNLKSECPEKVLDLSLNMKYYNNYSENKIEYANDLIKFKNDKIVINFIYYNLASILYFFGPKGCGKTTHLLFSSLDIHNYSDLNNPRLYIDYRFMKENSLFRNLIFKQEMFYMVQTAKELKDLYDLGYHREITKKNSFFGFFKEFLENIINSNKFDKKIIVIIDNYDEIDNYTEDNYLEEIIEFAKNNSKSIKLIISGNGSFIKGKQKLFINNKLSDSMASNHQICLECPKYEYEDNKVINKQIIPDFIYFHPEYYFRLISQKSDEININEFNSCLKQEEEDLCKNINFFGLYYALTQENKELSYEIFNKYYDILPNYYLYFIKNDKTISFQIANEIFKNAIKKTIEYDIEINSIKNLLQLYSKERTQVGIYEEKLLTLFLKFNKLNLDNLQFIKENILGVEQIYQFINLKFERYRGNIQKNKPIIITQANYKGKNYDLLILVPKENSDNYDAVFIQIGLNKQKNDIIKLENDISNNKSAYKKGIEKYLDINIKDIYLNFIFDKETQENIIDNGINSCGSNYCLLKNIKFYLFSLEDYQLFQLNNDRSCQIISFYEYKIENNNILGSKRFKFSNSMFAEFYNILDDDEIDELIKIKPKIKNINKYLTSKITSNILLEIKIFKSHLYIFTNYSDIKIFGIDSKLKIFKNGKFKDFDNCIPMNIELRKYDISLP